MLIVSSFFHPFFLPPILSCFLPSVISFLFLSSLLLSFPFPFLHLNPFPFNISLSCPSFPLCLAVISVMTNVNINALQHSAPFHSIPLHSTTLHCIKLWCGHLHSGCRQQRMGTPLAASSLPSLAPKSALKGPSPWVTWQPAGE